MSICRTELLWIHLTSTIAVLIDVNHLGGTQTDLYLSEKSRANIFVGQTEPKYSHDTLNCETWNMFQEQHLIWSLCFSPKLSIIPYTPRHGWIPRLRLVRRRWLASYNSSAVVLIRYYSNGSLRRTRTTNAPHRWIKDNTCNCVICHGEVFSKETFVQRVSSVDAL